jgi:exonuclease SbcC
MRPLTLELEGFTSFRQPACLDLRELDLFAVTGPTGAGKSSLIDSICYALYGRVPRVTNEVAACISQGMDRMYVRLEFLAGEDRYRIFRETRRKGAANVRLDRWLEGDWSAMADRAHDVTARVTDIVGLDYDGFTRSVLLPQGQFQEFLAGDPRQRRSVLGSLLRLDVYDRMRSRANTIAAELRTRLDERERELAGLAEATPENLERLEGELAERRVRQTQLQVETQFLAEGVELALALERERDRLSAARDAAANAESEMESTRALVGQGDEASAVLDADLTAVRSELAANQFDAERLTALTLGRERARELTRCVEELARVQTQREQIDLKLATASKATGVARERHEASQTALTAAESARREAEFHNLAAALQQGLKAGDACPVCGGAVGEMTPVAVNGLEAAQRTWEAARKAELAARAALQDAVDAGTKATLTAENIDQRVEDLGSTRARLEASLEDALQDGDDRSLTAIERALVVLTEARSERQRLDLRLRELTGQHETLKSQLGQARQALAVLDQRAVAARKALREADEAVATGTRELLALATKAAWDEITTSLTAGDDVALALKTRLASRQAEQHQTVLAIGQTEERLTRLRADIEKARGLRGEMESLKKEHAVAADLAQMLMANKFQAFVQSEALAVLAEDGSRRLEQLSAGRYRLTVGDNGQDFEVIDQWNADQARSVKTLSGGETFLASLSLSLALAESLPALAASRRVVLDSIFLDEGFGSLDAEALDRAADALDALRGENRMVCVVTHLQELAQRLPARVVVTKTESGSSVAVA